MLWRPHKRDDSPPVNNQIPKIIFPTWLAVVSRRPLCWGWKGPEFLDFLPVFCNRLQWQPTIDTPPRIQVLKKMVICPKYVLLCKKTKQIVGSGHEKWSFVLIEFSHFFLDIRPLYLDAQSTTPLDPRVLDAMLPYMTSFYGKFSLQLYSYVLSMFQNTINKTYI